MDLTAAQLREEFARMRRLAMMAAEFAFCAEEVGGLVQPFIDQYKALRLAKRGETPSSKLKTRNARHPRAGEIVGGIRAAAAGLQRAGVKGLKFHNGLQRAVSDMAEGFGYRGFTECGACYTTEEGVEMAGRMDVVWASARVPVVLFEIDSTVKPASLEKLKVAEAEHKFWVYFGPDVWAFKTLLRRADPGGEVAGVVVPRAFVPLRGEELPGVAGV